MTALDIFLLAWAIVATAFAIAYRRISWRAIAAADEATKTTEAAIATFKTRR